MNKKRAYVWLPIILILGFLFTNARASKESRKASALFMRQKLTYSESILEGMVLEHYEQVITNAARMQEMTLTNLWTQFGNPEYKAATRTFQTDVDNVISAAKAQNTTNLQAAYGVVTADCVDCHQAFRPDQYKWHRAKDAQERGDGAGAK